MGIAVVDTAEWPADTYDVILTPSGTYVAPAAFDDRYTGPVTSFVAPPTLPDDRCAGNATSLVTAPAPPTTSASSIVPSAAPTPLVTSLVPAVSERVSCDRNTLARELATFLTCGTDLTNLEEPYGKDTIALVQHWLREAMRVVDIQPPRPMDTAELAIYKDKVVRRLLAAVAGGERADSTSVLVDVFGSANVAAVQVLLHSPPPKVT